MFGMPALNSAINAGNNGNQGPQVRGFGFLHDGSVDTLFRFHNATVFNGGVDPHLGGPHRPPGGQVALGVDTHPAPIVRPPPTPTDTTAPRPRPPHAPPLARPRPRPCGLRGR